MCVLSRGTFMEECNHSFAEEHWAKLVLTAIITFLIRCKSNTRNTRYSQFAYTEHISSTYLQVRKYYDLDFNKSENKFSLKRKRPLDEKKAYLFRVYWPPICRIFTMQCQKEALSCYAVAWTYNYMSIVAGGCCFFSFICYMNFYIC